MRVKIYDDEFTGTPGEIVTAMREKAWDEGKTLEEYIERVASRVWRFTGKRVSIKGETTDELFRDFLEQLADLGIAKIEEKAS